MHAQRATRLHEVTYRASVEYIVGRIVPGAVNTVLSTEYLNVIVIHPISYRMPHPDSGSNILTQPTSFLSAEPQEALLYSALYSCVPYPILVVLPRSLATLTHYVRPGMEAKTTSTSTRYIQCIHISCRGYTYWPW